VQLFEAPSSEPVKATAQLFETAPSEAEELPLQVVVAVLFCSKLEPLLEELPPLPELCSKLEPLLEELPPLPEPCSPDVPTTCWGWFDFPLPQDAIALRTNSAKNRQSPGGYDALGLVFHLFAVFPKSLCWW